MKNIDKLLIVIVVASGAFVRFFPLGSKCLWLDEAISAYYLRYSPGETLRRSAEPGALHPPLFFLALQAWSKLWGDSEFALRSLAAAMGTLTILGIYLMVRELHHLDDGIAPVGRASRRAALLAAFLVASNPLHIHLSQIVRGYTLATGCLVLAGWLLLRSLREDKGSVTSCSMASLLMATSCYTHYIAILPVISQVLYAAAFLRFRPGAKAITDLSAIEARPPRAGGDSIKTKYLLIFILLFLLITLPCAAALLRTERWWHGVPTGGSLTAPGVATQTLLALSSTPDARWSPSPPAEYAWAAVALLLGTYLFLALRGGWGGWFLVASGLLPSVVLIVYSFHSSRNIYRGYYVIFPQLFWTASVAVVVAGIPGRAARSMATLAVIGLALASYGGSWRTVGPVTLRGVSTATRFVSGSRERGEVVICTSPHIYFPVSYYSRGRFRPTLLISEATGRRFFGSHYLGEGDLTGEGQLASLGAPGVWLIGGHVRAPDQWRLISKHDFTNVDLFGNKIIILHHYKIRRHRR